jgi:DNA repair photolyase
MYALSPLKVFVTERAGNNKVYVERMERMMKSLKNNPEVIVIKDSNLPDVIDELHHLWPPANPDGEPKTFTRPLIFTTMDIGYKKQDLTALLERCPKETTLDELKRIYGQMTTAIDQHPYQLDAIDDCVCWPTYNFGTVSGCSHGCLYCPAGREGKFISITLNLEEYMEKVVGPVIEANPWNKVFRMILDSADLVTLEPEYGLFDLFTRKLAQYPGIYGSFHTSSSNVDWVADLKHRDKLIGIWSVTCRSVARDIEQGTGDAYDRFDAAGRCQKLGIPVRYKFKPIIPVSNWRQEYTEAIDYALKKADPESVGFALYMWNTFESMNRTLPLDSFDQNYVNAARESAEEMKNSKTGPFPHNVRREIYRFFIEQVRRRDKKVLLYICTESREMWDDLKGELGQDPGSYICGCGSAAVPGKRLALSRGFRYSTYNTTPV